MKTGETQSRLYYYKEAYNREYVSIMERELDEEQRKSRREDYNKKE